MDVITGCDPVLAAHTVRLDGDIDLAAQDLIIDAVDAFRLCEHHDVVVECDGLTFIDSTGLTLIAHLRRMALSRGGEVTMDSPPSSLRRLLDITRLMSAPAAAHPVAPVARLTQSRPAKVS